MPSLLVFLTFLSVYVLCIVPAFLAAALSSCSGHNCLFLGFVAVPPSSEQNHKLTMLKGRGKSVRVVALTVSKQEPTRDGVG